MDLATRITSLRQTHARVQQMRATADSAITFARQQVQQIDAELRKAGINPENAAVEVAALDAQLEQEVTQLEASLQQEEAELKAILDLARQAQIIQ